MEGLKKKILGFIMMAAVLYLGFVIYADYDSFIKALSCFNAIMLPLLIILSLLNYMARFFKWDYYLRILNIKVPQKQSLIIFISGFVMTVTPGKMGELFKSYLLKDSYAAPVSKTAPIIVAERMTDFLSLCILAIAGSFVFNWGILFSLLAALFFMVLIIILSSKSLSLKAVSLTSKLPLIKKHSGSIAEAYCSARELLRPKPLILMLLLSSLAWGFECLEFSLVLQAFNPAAGFFYPAFAYCFSTIAGAISMLPGGLGITEGSLVFLTGRAGLPKESAIAATFIIRAATLWFALFVGIIGLSFYQRNHRMNSVI